MSLSDDNGPPSISTPLTAIPTKPDSALEGLVIVEFAKTLAGQAAGGLLADMGAQVVRVEPTSGTGTQSFRLRGPSLPGEADSLYFQCENRGKLSLSVDFTDLSMNQSLTRLLASADAVIEDLGPGVIEDFGLSLDTYARANERLSMLRISPFGSNGPLANERSDDRIAQAFSGVQYATGFSDRRPIVVAGPIAEYWTAMLGASGLLMAILHARRSGRGQTIDLALYEAVLRLADREIAIYGRYGTIPARSGNESSQVAPAGIFETGDGRFIALSGAGDQPFRRLCAAIGVPELSEDEMFHTEESRLAHGSEINGFVREWIRARTFSDVTDLFVQKSVTAAPILSAADIVADPHLQARQSIASLSSISGKSFLAPGVTPRLSRTPGARPLCAPRLGEHNSLFRGAHFVVDGREQIADSKTGETGMAALSGIRVVDLGRWLAGPVAATLLADFGADVIMVELPGSRPCAESPIAARELAFLATNRNKRSVTLDIRTELGRRALLDLVAVSDVLVENFRVGTLERWGLGPLDLLQVNPTLVMLRASGYGQTGPYARRPAFNPVGLAIGGATYVGGWPDRPPLRDGVTAADYTTALMGQFGVLCALLRRHRDGLGQVVDVSLVESVLRMTGDLLAVQSGLGITRERAAGAWPLYPIAFTDRAADGRYVAVSADSWMEVRYALDGLDIAVGRSAANVSKALSDYVRRRGAKDVVISLRSTGLAASVVQNLADVSGNVQTVSRQNLISLRQDGVGEILLPDALPKMSSTPGCVTSAPLEAGRENHSVLHELLGYEHARISKITGS